MSTDVMTPGRTGEAERRRGTGQAAAASQRTAPAPDARRPTRPARRPRPDRPASPVLPARPVSPVRPAGPGRPGRTIRTGGPARQAHGDERAQHDTQIRPGGQPAAAAAAAEPARHPGRTSFVILVLGLLSGGLICLLMVNTTLAANSIEITDLQQANAARTERIQQLEQQVAAQQSAAVIEQKALKLGMRPEQVPTFVDLRSHSIRVGKGTRP